MVEDEFEELNDLVMEILENQKVTLNEIRYLTDDVKAQNRLLSELLKIQKVNQETALRQTKMLEDILKK